MLAHFNLGGDGGNNNIQGIFPYLITGPMKLKIVPDPPLLSNIKAHAHDVISMLWNQAIGQQLSLVLHFPQSHHVRSKVILNSF